MTLFAATYWRVIGFSMAEAVPDIAVLTARCWTTCLAVAASCSLAIGSHCFGTERGADALP